MDPAYMWKEQCEAAKVIADKFGKKKGLGYIIGEKFINFLRAARQYPDFEKEVPHFAAEIQDAFDVLEIADYFNDVKRIGALGHVLSDEEHEEFREFDVIDDNPVSAAEDVLFFDQAKKLLMD